MKIQIWSDVMCPFCYIGKRRFEEALNLFEFKDKVQVEWKSFQLNPALITDTSIGIDEYLADAKGWQLDYAQQLNKQVTEMAAQVGLTYNLDRAVVANSFNAHRFTHLAKQHNLGEAAEEQLFKAYFTNGKNIDDINILTQIGLEVGLDAAELNETLNNPDAYANNVHADVQEAQALGISSVPFFVMNNQYAVCGAQPMEVFTNTLYSAYAE
ncbi:DsbA family oxidoreductase [Mucilaginibacter terrae]|uniref:DsbA family oxidoreductase n=1 Tax=Mucilaginibacter terrae TaxID=1955052 RepID=UPI0036344DDC